MKISLKALNSKTVPFENISKVMFFSFLMITRALLQPKCSRATKQ